MMEAQLTTIQVTTDVRKAFKRVADDHGNMTLNGLCKAFLRAWELLSPEQRYEAIRGAATEPKATAA